MREHTYFSQSLRPDMIREMVRGDEFRLAGEHPLARRVEITYTPSFRIVLERVFNPKIQRRIALAVLNLIDILARKSQGFHLELLF